MRQTFRLLAAAKPARYLEVGTPTGLTGLYTHASPRSTLLYLYNTTLERLKAFPESSMYRTSTEAITKHRMSLVEATVPPGYQEWVEKAAKIVKEHPEHFNKTVSLSGASVRLIHRDGQTFVIRTEADEGDERYQEWDGERDDGPGNEGLRAAEERTNLAERLDQPPADVPSQIAWEAEPQMTAEQVEELETKIGAGLIEEVVQVAESELKLLDVMLKSKVWEDLEEKPAPGQWEYFERKAM